MTSTPLVPVILKVYLSNSSDTVSEIPVTPATTCKDVIDCCKEPGEEQCHLAELWRGCERPIGDEEKPYEILQQWGIHREEVKFFLRHENAVPLGNVNPGNFKLPSNGDQPLSSTPRGGAPPPYRLPPSFPAQEETSFINQPEDGRGDRRASEPAGLQAKNIGAQAKDDFSVILKIYLIV
uniref:Apoptosis-stimulating of p53 protein 1-like n=1 Tax=Saccoglossus kowalevskii TaxID=10224 RepID=A0ABM0N0A3_SACKO|nr:PREDICTED: apoptosis-stimulating of p53 protein 1-like [Saccoglossus kowalevskii]